MQTKTLTEEGRDIINGIPKPTDNGKYFIDINTRAGLEKIIIEPRFTGTVTIQFNQGGCCGIEKNVKLK
jgi:hypothetical protein